MLQRSWPQFYQITPIYLVYTSEQPPVLNKFPVMTLIITRSNSQMMVTSPTLWYLDTTESPTQGTFSSLHMHKLHTLTWYLHYQKIGYNRWRTLLPTNGRQQGQNAMTRPSAHNATSGHFQFFMVSHNNFWKPLHSLAFCKLQDILRPVILLPTVILSLHIPIIDY